MSKMISSVQELIETIKTDIEQYKNEMTYIDCLNAVEHREVWFRGMKDSAYKLLPSAFRNENFREFEF
jgi:hypothetical protein